MKKLILITLIIITTTTLSAAQDISKQTKEPAAGIAVNISTFNFFGMESSGIIVAGNSISVPLNIGKSFRIEPELAMLFHHEDYIYSSGYDTYIFAGLGIFLKKRMENISFLYGARIGMMNIVDDKGVYITPAIGAEYHISRRFSIGGEIQINNTILGRLRTTAIQTPVSLRFYF